MSRDGKKLNCKYCGRPLDPLADYPFKNPYPYCHKGCELKFKRRGRNKKK